MEQYYKKYSKVLGMYPKKVQVITSEKKEQLEKVNFIKEEIDPKLISPKNEELKINEVKNQFGIDSQKESKEISEENKFELKDEESEENEQQNNNQIEKNNNNILKENENDPGKANLFYKAIIFGDNDINSIDLINFKDLQFENLIIVKFFEELGGTNPMLMIEEKKEENKNPEIVEEEDSLYNKNNKSEKKYSYNHFHELSINERISILYYLCYLKANVEEKDYSQHINDNNEIKSIRQIDPIGVDANNFEYYRFEFNKDGRIYKLAPLLERKNNGDRI